MSREFRMPSLGADMEDGTLVEWRVAPGAHVACGDVVALVETEKGVIDIESFEEGTIEKLAVAAGTRVPVNTVLAWFAGEPTAAPAAAPAVAQAAPPAPAPAQTAPPAPRPAVEVAAAPPSQSAPTPTRGRARVSPAARAHAAALGIDLANLTGTGPDGVITLHDVEAHVRPATPASPAPPAAPPPASPAPDAGERMRHAIATAMSHAKRDIPHYYEQLSLDFQAAASWLEAYNAARPVPERILAPVLLVKAVARAAAEKPGFNGTYGPNGFEPAAAVHLGVAIAQRRGGLIAPAILGADRKPLAELMHDLQDLVARVRTGHLRASELASATLTLSALGDEGVDSFYPIIHPPQVAIVGSGAIALRPWVVDGRVEARPVLTLTLAADHRVTDGRTGAQFLSRIRDLLSRPEEL